MNHIVFGTMLAGPEARRLYLYSTHYRNAVEAVRHADTEHTLPVLIHALQVMAQTIEEQQQRLVRYSMYVPREAL